MALFHTLLFLLRENTVIEDLTRSYKCLKSLEKSSCKTVVIYNQGFWNNNQLSEYLEIFALNCIIIGEGENVGIIIGRQACFEWIWKNHQEASFVSELHLDMIFTHNWEDPLIEYLSNNDEPVICSGIVEKNGHMPCINKNVEPPPNNLAKIDEYLLHLKEDSVVHGFTHPCIHNMHILKEIGGIMSKFFKGKQAFEDDSLLLGYHYYYGTKANWKPKVSYQTVVYHEIGGQRYSLNDNVMFNFDGLVKQYGVMGIKQLANIHSNQWSVQFFEERYSSFDKQ